MKLMKIKTFTKRTFLFFKKSKIEVFIKLDNKERYVGIEVKHTQYSNIFNKQFDEYMLKQFKPLTLSTFEIVEFKSYISLIVTSIENNTCYKYVDLYKINTNDNKINCNRSKINTCIQ